VHQEKFEIFDNFEENSTTYFGSL